MSSVSKKRGVSKEVVVRSRRTFSKTRRYARIGKPASETKGATSQEPGLWAREELEQARKELERVAAKREALGSLPVTLSLTEACALVGRDLDLGRFQECVFEVLARELDVLSDLSESAENGFDVWCAFQNLTARIRLAGKIAAVIGGAS